MSEPKEIRSKLSVSVKIRLTKILGTSRTSLNMKSQLNFTVKSNESDNPKSFQVHKHTLSLRSPFFKDLFSIENSLLKPETADDETGQITLPYSSGAIELIVNFIDNERIPNKYTCETIKFEDLIQAFLAADFLEIPLGQSLSENMLESFYMTINKHIVYTRKYKEYAREKLERETRIREIGAAMEKYEFNPLVSENEHLRIIQRHYDLEIVKNFEQNQRQLKNDISKQCLFRILSIPPTHFQSYTISDPTDRKPRSYTSTFEILITWLQNHFDFRPAKSCDFVLSEVPEFVLEIAMFAYETIQFARFPRKFVIETVDCGLFSEEMMLEVYLKMC
ncbi:hypothetical protein HK098_002458 [Nowakowskiella sp. JEL0407]|nr:hypothetical protein HK098_002458 [Nowakowskiella sp. JEL0407]